MVELRKIDKDNYLECFKLAVSDEQKRFVATNEFSLAQAWVFYANTFPLAIYADDLMVGFALYGPEESKNGVYLDRLMIDERFQGKGYGRLALTALIELIKDSLPYKQIFLSCHPANTVAAKLYDSFGFVKTGEFLGDEYIAVLEL